MELVYRSYYTKSSEIVSYMLAKLELESGNRVLEPCAGDGAFVDAIINATQDVSLDLYELNPAAIEKLRSKYGGNYRIRIFNSDTITDHDLTLQSNFGNGYDRVIGNPPYGGWLDYEKRGHLKKIYDGMYVKETYGLFLCRCLDLLNPGGRLVFIVPDTFLNLHMHTPLRQRLLKGAHIEEIAMFPSAFFPGVKYGYSQMCIITLRKARPREDLSCQDIRIISGLSSPRSLLDDRQQSARTIRQGEMAANIDSALFICDSPGIEGLINRCDISVGDVAACVTGFYSGNDVKYVRPLHHNVRSAKRYKAVEKTNIAADYCGKGDLLNGLGGELHFVPIMKGGRKRYWKAHEWFVDWGTEAVAAYRSNPKARFQNSGYYFRHGIGVPMVSSSSISAAIIEDCIFDQSIVGIFPNESRWLYYLLAFFNSKTCHNLIRTINPSANNSANYIKKIPLILPDESDSSLIECLVERVLTQKRQTDAFDHALHDELGEIIARIYGF